MKKHLLIVLALIVAVLSFSSCTHEHVWGEWTVTTEATCTADGEQTRTCECGETEKQAIPAKGHDLGAEATCTEAQKCTVCNAELTAAKGHTSGEWVVVTPATSTATGLKIQKCTVCGVTLAEETIPMIDLTAKGLEYVVNEDGVTCTIIGIGTFSGTELIIPSVIDGYTVTVIGSQAFAGLDYDSAEWYVTRIVIPDSVLEIQDNAFVGCVNAESIEIGSGLMLIYPMAFPYSVGFGEILVPASLTTITISTNNPYYCSVDGIVFSKDMTAIVCYPAGKTETSYTIPSTVTIIDYGAFVGCLNLTAVELHEGVTEIREAAFAMCSNLTSIDLPDGLTTISALAFMSSGLTSLEIPEGVTRIGEMAFNYCFMMTSIKIPASVTAINLQAFYGCYNLTTIYFEGTMEQWNNIEKGEMWSEPAFTYNVICTDGEIILE